MSFLDNKEIEYIESMKHLLGCVCKDKDGFEFSIHKLLSYDDGLWDCYDFNRRSFCELEELTFFDEDGNVIGDYIAYTFKYYGIKVD